MEGASSPLRSATIIGISEAARVLQALGICKAFGPSGRINGPNCQRFGNRDPSTGRWSWDVAELIRKAHEKRSASTEDIEAIAKQYGLPTGLPVSPDQSRAQATARKTSRAPLHRDDLLRDLDVYLADLVALLNSPRHPFSSLAEKDVPDTAGLYVIYRDDATETLYVGKARNLRFRIMKNHLAYQGDDNFVRYLMREIGLTSRSEARTHIRKLCSIHWVEVDDPQRLFILEHLAIAATRARFNRG